MSAGNDTKVFRNAFMYFNNNSCPLPNMYGKGTDCQACNGGNAGAQCPGGYKIWPGGQWVGVKFDNKHLS